MKTNFSRTSWISRGIVRAHILLNILLLYSRADDSVSKNLPLDSGLYCYARCLAACVETSGVDLSESECHKKCESFSDKKLCHANDDSCWRRCKSLFDLDNERIPKTPKNLTVAYVTSPQPSPHEADVRWHAVDDATFYMIQVKDMSDEFSYWSDGGLNTQVIPATQWHFVKPALCPDYAFRVASVNQYGVSSFSEIINLTTPQPIAPAAAYSVRSAQLINESYVDHSRGIDALDNTTLKLLIYFSPPPNWDMATDIVHVNAELYVQQCGHNGHDGTLTHIVRQVARKSEFEIRLPGSLSTLQCSMMFIVKSLNSKCDPKVDVPYPADAYDSIRNAMLPGITFVLNCSNIHGSICPFKPLSLEPVCGVQTQNLEVKKLSNDSSFANVSISFERYDARSDVPILHYVVRYGETNVEPPVQFYIVTISTVIGDIIVENTTDHFTLPGLDIHKNYAYRICAIYKSDSNANNISWDHLNPAYLINLRQHLSDNDQKLLHGHPASTPTNITTYAIAIAIPVVLVLLLFIGIFLICLLRSRRPKSIGELKIRPPGWPDDRYIIMPEKIDTWEIDRQDLITYQDQKLGSGAFGSVFKCKLLCPLNSKDAPKPVLAENWIRLEDGEAAVKLLPEYADETAKSSFRQEINLMKNLGHHERLVNMLGCVTATEPLCLIVEYCEDGDLLHYLRDRRNYMIELESTGVDLNNLTEQDNVKMDLLLCFKDLISFAWQISVGLEYLSQKGYIHRDVAARNVLVGKGKRAKIGDFGLCRYSYDDSVYFSHGGRLPFKWMALEAIKHYEFTSKSDVWSYGVLLFEIITMGGTPYPNVQPTDLEEYLESGNRMDQPDHCPPILYAIMLECWRALPNDRPTFTQLREGLRVLLEEVTYDYAYLRLNQARDYYNIITNDYPLLAFAQSLPQNNFVTATIVNQANTTTEAVRINNDQKIAASEEMDYIENLSQLPSPSPTQSPSNTLSHRDSAGSDQFLITPTTPKVKFFKFKNAATTTNTLASLPEGGSGSNENSDPKECSCESAVYLQDLLPEKSKDKPV